MLTVEIQYCNNCPIVNELIINTKSAIDNLQYELEYRETIFKDEVECKAFKGCPTLLVNNRDYEGKVKYDKNKPFCRVYKNGIPTAEDIRRYINYNY